MEFLFTTKLNQMILVVTRLFVSGCRPEKTFCDVTHSTNKHRRCQKSCSASCSLVPAPSRCCWGLSGLAESSTTYLSWLTSKLTTLTFAYKNDTTERTKSEFEWGLKSLVDRFTLQPAFPSADFLHLFAKVNWRGRTCNGNYIKFSQCCVCHTSFTVTGCGGGFIFPENVLNVSETCPLVYWSHK